MIIPLIVILLGGGASLFFSEEETETEVITSVERVEGNREEMEITISEPEEGEKVIITVVKEEEEEEEKPVILEEVEMLEGLDLEEVEG